MLSLHNHHSSTGKKGNSHKLKRLHLSVWRRLLNPGGVHEERAAPSEAPSSLNRGLCELEVGWTPSAGGVGGVVGGVEGS